MLLDNCHYIISVKLLFVKLYDIIHFTISFWRYQLLRNFSHTIKRLSKQTSAVVTALICIVTTISPISVMAADSATTYKFSDISLQVSVPDDLVGFTRNVTSNNAYLDKVGTDDVEELRSLMITNNIYLEAIPKTNDINYEILINGKNADTSVKNFNEADEDTLNTQFTQYVEACDNIENSSVTENVTSSSIYKNHTTSYFVVDVKSVSNNKVTTYIKKYYTVMMGKSITYTLQSNENEISQKLLSIVDSAEYKEIAKSITDSQFFTEIMSSVITVLIPIAILGVIVFFMSKSTKKTKKQIEADEERYRAQYAREAEEKAEKEVQEKAQKENN